MCMCHGDGISVPPSLTTSTTKAAPESQAGTDVPQ